MADETPNVVGWNRIKQIYKNKDLSMEFVLTKTAATYCFACGFVVGGIQKWKSANERFQMYATGKFMGNRRNYIRRYGDYMLLMFAKNGIKPGLLMGLLGGTIMYSIIHMADYRDHFSIIYPPILSATICAFFMSRAGLQGIATGMGLGFSTGALISLAITGSALIERMSVDDFYKSCKKQFEERLRILHNKEEKLRRIMKEEGIRLKIFAEWRLIELEKKEEEEQTQQTSPLDEFGEGD